MLSQLFPRTKNLPKLILRLPKPHIDLIFSKVVMQISERNHYHRCEISIKLSEFKNFE